MTPALLLLAMSAPPEVPTELWQVAPGEARVWTAPKQPVERARAVVLVHGLQVHPLRSSKVTKPELRPWQQPKSILVSALAKDADVFAFSYGQTTTVDEVARAPGLRDAVANLRKAGYKELVLVGHSAGGVLVRVFAEENPTAGVAKAISVAAPFDGAKVATYGIGYPKVQAPFVKSLAPDARIAPSGTNRLAPGNDTQFACVVCKLKRGDTDGVVSTRSQWPEDLQKLGIPIVVAPVAHTDAMQDAATTKLIHALATEKITRWSADEVETARRLLFGEPDPKREK
ncbi:MAG: esterase/lipase family protein [Gemmata sp.]